jgi:hypothetical protein
MEIGNKNMAGALISAVKVMCIKRSDSFRSFDFLVESKKNHGGRTMFLFGLHVDSTHNELVIAARNIKCMLI